MAQQEPTLTATALPVEAASPTVAVPTPDTQRQSIEYASVAHALQAQALTAEDPFLAYALAIDAASISNPPGEAYSALLSMVFDTNAVNHYSIAPSSAAALGFGSDGATLNVLDTSSHLAQFDTATGELLHSYVAPRGYLAGSDFLSDGSELLVTQPDNQLILRWNMATGRASRIAVHQQFSYIRFTPDGQYALAATYFESDLVLWDLTNNELVRTLPGYANTVTSIAISPDGSLALVGYYDGRLNLYDLTTGALLRILEHPHESQIDAVEFNPNGFTALATSGGNLMIWNIGTGSLIDDIPNLHGGRILDAAYTPDGYYFVTGGTDGKVRLWDTEFTTFLQEFSGHTASVNRVAVSPDGRTIVSSDVSGAIMLWGRSTIERQRTFFEHEGGVTSAIFSPDGRYVASGDSFNTILLWDPTNAYVLRTFTGHTGAINSLAFTPDERYLLSASADGTAKLWDVSSGELVADLNVNGGQMTSAALSPDGLQAFISSGGVAVVWDINPQSDTFNEPLRPFDVTEGTVLSVSYSADGRLLAASASTGGLTIWHAQTGAEVQRINSEDAQSFTHIAFSPDSSSILVVLQDGSMALLDTASGEARVTFAGHPGGTYSTVFSPDGRTILSGGIGSDMILWDATTGQRIRIYNSYMTTLGAVAFSPDGRFALSGSQDHTIQVWNIPTIPELMNTLRTERFVPVLSCEQRIAYRVEPYCAADGTQPSITPYPSMTPTALSTAIFPTPTSYPSRTPAATPVAAANRAEAGEQHGEVQVGGGEVWTYYGSYGETLNIRVVADNPANDNEDRVGLFDSYLSISSPAGRVLYVSDDIDPGVVTDSYISGLVLAATGVYEIEVRSWNNESGGTYTLIIESTPYSPTATPTEARTLAGEAVQGEQCGYLPTTETVYWELPAQAGDVLTAMLTGTCESAAEPFPSFDTTLRIYAPDGTELAYNDDIGSGNYNSLLDNLSLTQNGTYLIEVSSFSHSSGGYYTLEITLESPETSAEATVEATAAP
ncbi:MAG: WD40 repeat domain-containing protein [Anaerolineae bacterium]